MKITLVAAALAASALFTACATPAMSYDLAHEDTSDTVTDCSGTHARGADAWAVVVEGDGQVSCEPIGAN